MMVDVTLSPWETSAQVFAQNVPFEWISIAMSAVMIIALMLVILYMVSKIFGSRTLEATVRREFFQLGATVLLIAFLGMFSATESFILAGNKDFRDMLGGVAAEQILGKSGYQVSIFDVSYVYMVSSLKCLKAEYTKQLKAQPYEMLPRVNLGLTIIGGNYPLPLPLVIDLATGAWGKLMQAIMDAEEILWLSLATYFQINFLQWIEASMVTVYLPLGIMLRAFPYTRGGGAALMGIAISLYFVYPFLLTVLFVNAPPLPPECSIAVEIKESEDTGATEGAKMCPSDPAAIESLISGAQGNAPEGSSGFGKLISSDVGGFSPDKAGRIRLYAYFYPFVAMAGTFLFARSLTQVLGGNISDIGRGMVRVI
ncbi:MAG: hypothetical protein N3H30_01020 [Candidatus Micrarchaeota archaeon]|nr:hypothetical protein [Candidatus Micrarchaeota archaeon]